MNKLAIIGPDTEIVYNGKSNKNGISEYTQKNNKSKKIKIEDLDKFVLLVGEKELRLDPDMISRSVHQKNDQNTYNQYYSTQLITKILGSNTNEQKGGEIMGLIIFFTLGIVLAVFCAGYLINELRKGYSFEISKCWSSRSRIGGGFGFKKGSSTYHRLNNNKNNNNSTIKNKMSPLKIFKMFLSTSYFELPLKSDEYKCYMKVKFLGGSKINIIDIVFVPNSIISEMEEHNTKYFNNIINWINEKYPKITSDNKFKRFFQEFSDDYENPDVNKNTIPLLSNFN